MVTGLLDPQNGMIAISTAVPQPREYTVEDLLVPGKSVVLAGFGGTSKTQLAFHLAVSIALGTPFGCKAVKQGSVMMCLGEEDRDEVTRRISAIARYQGLTPSQIQLVEQNLRAFPLVGHDTRLSIRNGKALTEVKFGQEIIAAVNVIGNVRLLVLDHMGLFHGGDFNAREDAALTHSPAGAPRADPAHFWVAGAPPQRRAQAASRSSIRCRRDSLPGQPDPRSRRPR
jgi:hypothetical protein